MKIDSTNRRAWVDTAMLAVTLAAGSVGLWLWIGSLGYWKRDSLLVYFAIILLLYPLIAWFLRRWAGWIYWPLPIFGVALGLRYCGDMGEDGHYITAGFTMTAALWAITLGAILRLGKRRATRSSDEKPSIDGFPATQRAGQYWWRACLLLLLVLSLGWASAAVMSERHTAAERQKIGAPFVNAGMRVYCSADGSISIQSYSSFKDADLASIQKELESLPNLKILNLYFSGVTDTGLVHLRNLNNLKDLCLFRTAVTDAGLPALKSLTGLEQLDVRDTKVSADGVAELQKHLPNCLIEY